MSNLNNTDAFVIDQNDNTDAKKVTVQQIKNNIMGEFPVELPASDVFDWAKQPSKPSYTASEVGALPEDTEIPDVYELPIASKDVLGGIKLGEGLESDGNGTVSVKEISNIKFDETVKSGTVLVGTSIVVGEVAGNLNDIYINTETMDVYKCINANETAATWEYVTNIDETSETLNTNNLINEANLYRDLVKTSDVQINGEDTYLLDNQAINFYYGANEGNKYYFGIYVNEDTFTQYGGEISVSENINGTWHWSIMVENIKSANENHYVEFEICLHPECTQFAINLNASNKKIWFNRAILVKGLAKQTYYQSRIYYENILKDNLCDNMVVCFGDSIIRGVGNNNVSFIENLPVATRDAIGIRNCAIGGAIVSYTDTTTKSYLKKQIDNYFKLFDADIVFMNGMVNECWSTSTYTLGEITDDYDSEFDTTTFCGALEEIFKYFKTEHPNIKLVYFTPHKCTDAIPNLLRYVPVALEICKKWGVPVLDFFNECQLLPSIDQHNELYFYEQDRCHFNGAGYDYLTNWVEQTIRHL